MGSESRGPNAPPAGPLPDDDDGAASSAAVEPRPVGLDMTETVLHRTGGVERLLQDADDVQTARAWCRSIRQVDGDRRPPRLVTETWRGLDATSRPADAQCRPTDGSGVSLRFWCCASVLPQVKSSSWATA